MKSIFCLLVVAALSVTATAQEATEKENQLTIGMQVRSRAEYRNGALNPRDEGVDPTGFVNSRARLSIDYQRKGLEVKFAAQHVGVWGQDALVDKNGRFSLNEAWGKIDISDNWFVQAGRQSLAYDDERILGALDWNVAGRYHDALKVGFHDGGHQLHGIFAFNQNDEKINGGTYYDNSTTKLYKNMQTLWYHYQHRDCPLGVSILAMNLGQEAGDSDNPKTKYMQTFGTHISYAPKGWNLTGSFYYQTGKTTAGRSIAAYMASLRGTYNFAPKWSVTLAEDYLSGSKSATGDYKAFNPLYGTHHKFYGAMDYFYASDFQSGYAPGLSDTQVGLAWQVAKPTKLSLNYHYFATGVKLEGLDRTLGHEIDLQVDVKIAKDVSLAAGYSTMFGTDTMDAVKGGCHDSWQDWAYVSLNINPQMFFKF